jgi:hypothetical protein
VSGEPDGNGTPQEPDGERTPREPDGEATPQEPAPATSEVVAAPLPPVAPMPAEFFPRWRAPSAPPTQRVLGASAAVGLTTAVVLPLDRAGIGWFVAAVVAAVAVTVLVRHAHRLDPTPHAGRMYAGDAAWGLAAVGLTGVAALRDAEWLVALCLLAAACAASIAVAGRHFRSLVFSAMAVPLAGLRALPWVGKALWAARHDAGARGVRTAVSGVVGLFLVAVFAPLLAAADPAFDRLLDDMLPTLDDSGLARAWLFALAAGAVLGSGFLLAAPPAPPGPRAEGPARLRRIEWALPIGLLVALFALFVGVQFAALFGSDDYVLRTTGVTYAEYARRGFWQLLVVTVLALGVVLLASRYAPAATAADRAWKRGLLATLAGLTLVIVASALSRMWLYQEAYGFTTLRLVVLACELWLGVCFLLVLVAVLRLRAGPVLRQMAAAGVVALLALAALDPERFIATQNIARYAVTGELDTYYLSTLSADALPALLDLPEWNRCTTVSTIVARSLDPDADWRSWNAARAAARTALAEAGC